MGGGFWACGVVVLKGRVVEEEEEEKGEEEEEEEEESMRSLSVRTVGFETSVERNHGCIY